MLRRDEGRPKCRNCTRRELRYVYFSNLGTSQPSRIAILELVLSSDKGKEGATRASWGRRSPKVVVSLKTASKKLSPQHADALFAAACLTAMYVFMCPPVVENIPRVPSWIPVLVGITATGQRCWAWLQNGELAALMAPKADPRRYPTEDVKFPSSLLDLSRRSTLGELDPRELENHLVLRVYHDATKALEESWDLFWLTEPKVSTLRKSSCPSLQTGPQGPGAVGIPMRNDRVGRGAILVD